MGAMSFRRVRPNEKISKYFSHLGVEPEGKNDSNKLNPTCAWDVEEIKNKTSDGHQDSDHDNDSLPCFEAFPMKFFHDSDHTPQRRFHRVCLRSGSLLVFPCYATRAREFDFG